MFRHTRYFCWHMRMKELVPNHLGSHGPKRQLRAGGLRVAELGSRPLPWEARACSERSKEGLGRVPGKAWAGGRSHMQARLRQGSPGKRGARLSASVTQVGGRARASRPHPMGLMPLAAPGTRAMPSEEPVPRLRRQRIIQGEGEWRTFWMEGRRRDTRPGLLTQLAATGRSLDPSIFKNILSPCSRVPSVSPGWDLDLPEFMQWTTGTGSFQSFNGSICKDSLKRTHSKAVILNLGLMNKIPGICEVGRENNYIFEI